MSITRVSINLKNIISVILSKPYSSAKNRLLGTIQT